MALLIFQSEWLHLRYHPVNPPGFGIVGGPLVLLLIMIEKCLVALICTKSSLIAGENMGKADPNTGPTNSFLPHRTTGTFSSTV